MSMQLNQFTGRTPDLTFRMVSIKIGLSFYNVFKSAPSPLKQATKQAQIK